EDLGLNERSASVATRGPEPDSTGCNLSGAGILLFGNTPSAIYPEALAPHGGKPVLGRGQARSADHLCLFVLGDERSGRYGILCNQTDEGEASDLAGELHPM